MAMPAAVRHFDTAAARYSRFRGGALLGMLRRQERQALINMARLRPGDRVLDAGCGDGEVLEWLRQRGTRAVGIDASSGMAAVCRRRGLPVSVQDMERLGVRPVFDWVMCIGALEFAADPRRALCGLAGSLGPHGRLILLFPRRSLLNRLYAAYHRAHGVAISVFSAEQITAWLRDAGMQAPREWHHCTLSTLCLAERCGAVVAPGPA